MLGLKLNHVSKRGHWNIYSLPVVLKLDKGLGSTVTVYAYNSCYNKCLTHEQQENWGAYYKSSYCGPGAKALDNQYTQFWLNIDRYQLC